MTDLAHTTSLESGPDGKDEHSQYQQQQQQQYSDLNHTDTPSAERPSLHQGFLRRRRKYIIIFVIVTALIIVVAIAVPLSIIHARNQHLHDGSALTSINAKSIIDSDNENTAANSTSDTSSPQSSTPSSPHPFPSIDIGTNQNRTTNGTIPYREYTTLITPPAEQQRSLHPPHYAHAVSPYANLTRIKQLYPATNSRMFIMGDIHGCLTEMNKLLDQVHFQPNSSDILIIAGDLVYRGEDSIGVIRKARELGAYCVRGNHDDKVVRLKSYELQHGASEMATHPAEDILPEGNVHDPLKFGNKHLEIVNKMNVDDFNYLAGCPLILDIPDLNARVVHGGVDPSVPNVIDNDPWAVMNMREFDEHNEPSKLKLSKHDPSNTAVKHWTTFYDQYYQTNQPTKQRQQFASAMSDNRGSNYTTTTSVITDLDTSNSTAAPATPITVANTTETIVSNTMELNSTNATNTTTGDSSVPTIYYGHDASRGLQVGVDTVGLDSGCVYGRQLTAIEVKTKNITQIDCTGRTYKRKKKHDGDEDQENAGDKEDHDSSSSEANDDD